MCDNRKVMINRIGWRCRRGMYELDMLLNTFYTQSIHKLSHEELAIIHQLLCLPDELLYQWFYCYQAPDDEQLAWAVSVIKQQASNEYNDNKI